jgi:hypothetical protein
VNGPLELLVFSFAGHEIRSEIVRAFDVVRSQDAIRIVDVVFLVKGPDGTTVTREIADLNREHAEALGAVDVPSDAGVAAGWFAIDDIDEVGRQMEPGTTAILVLFEHTWAGALRTAAEEVTGSVLVDARVARPLAERVEHLIARHDPDAVYAADDQRLRRVPIVRRRGLGLLSDVAVIPASPSPSEDRPHG